jgi:hypothetical protein
LRKLALGAGERQRLAKRAKPDAVTAG